MKLKEFFFKHFTNRSLTRWYLYKRVRLFGETYIEINNYESRAYFCLEFRSPLLSKLRWKMGKASGIWQIHFWKPAYLSRYVR